MPDPTVSRSGANREYRGQLSGRVQWWLQGHPDKHRPRIVIWLGNRIADARYWTWRLTGGN